MRLIVIAIFILGIVSNSFSSVYRKSVYSLPLTLDPIRMDDTSSLLAGNLLYDGLLKFSENLELQPALAKSWSFTKDGKVLKITLKDKIYFSDGKRISSDDVVYSLKRSLGSKSLVRNYFECVEGYKIEGQDDFSKIKINAINTNSLEIHLNKRFPAFLNVLAGATSKIIPNNSANKINFFDSPIGSGPFRFVSKNPRTNTVVVEKNKYYFKKVSLDQIELIESSEKDAISKAEVGLIDDLTNWPLSSDNKIFKKGNLLSTPVAATWIIGLNSNKSPFNDASIRKKFKRDFESEGFRKTFYPDALKAYGYIPPGLPGHINNSFNINAKSERSTKEKITIHIPKALEQHLEMKRLIEDMYSKKGWIVEVIPVEWKELMAGYQKKELQAFLVSMNMDYPDPEFLLRNFESTNPDNYSGIKSSVIDTSLSHLRATSDRAERKKITNTIVKEIEDSAVAINLFHPRANYWISACISNFKPNILSDVYIDYTEVTKSEKCQ